MLSLRTVLHSVTAAIVLALPHARAAFPTVALKAVCLQQIHSPTTITSAPDGTGRLFVCDQLGKIYIIQGGMVLPVPFLNIASTANTPPNNGPGPVVTLTTTYDERGLLGLAFHPGFANPASPGYRKFYINYNKNYVPGAPDFDPPPPVADHTPNCVTVIAEFQVSLADPNVAVLASQRRLLVFTQPQANHNGGQLEFGPDGFLYIGCGDGGSANDNNVGHTGGSAIAPRPTNNLGNAQDRRVLLGKILRIDPLGTNGPGGQYGIPAGNPFVGQSQSIVGHPEFDGPMRGEIFSFGMRNPWRFSFDKRAGGTNRIFCGDVGQGRIEEIDLIVSGGNYGWRYKEGTELPSFSSGSPTNPMPDFGTGPYINPIAMYAHPGVVTSPVLPQLGLSVTGGFVYRGAAIPAMQGKYVFGDYGSTSGASDGRMMGLEETAPLSGVFTLTQAIPLLGTANPIVGQRILGMGEDESGEIYVGMKTNFGVLQLGGDGLPAGGIYKIVPIESVTKTLPASKDNTIFSEDVDLARSYSDGIGYLYAGRTGSNFGPYNRRALVAFDLAVGVPSSAVIQSAQLKLYRIKAGAAGSSNTPFSAYRCTETWGEGTSQNISGGFGAPATTNDATWAHRFFNTSSWSTPGGSFNATASATLIVTPSDGPLLTWTSTAMKSDVQGWLNTPASNAGWIIRSDETTNLTASQYSSKQTGGVPPALTLTYDAAPPPTHFETWLATYFPANRVGQYVDPNTSFSNDGVGSLVKYAYGLSPLTVTPVGAGLQASSVVSGANPADTICTYTFRRDADAKDLTYVLQTSGDLISWSNIVQSTAGAVSSGTGFVSEGNAGGQIMLVTAQETVLSPVNRFVRIRVSRAP